VALKTMTVAEFHVACRAQGAPSSAHLCFVCPACGSVQSANDLIAAGAGKTQDDVEKYLGFSCVGRFTHRQPAHKRDGRPGCDWTLGGFFAIHTLEVTTEDGKKHPHFDLATPEQTQKHLGVPVEPQTV
jgi:hypothetical protein